VKVAQKLIKSRRTGFFLSPGWVWTPDLKQAHRFSNMTEVTKAARRLKGFEIELMLMVFDAPSQYDISMPLNGAPEHPKG